MRTLNVDTSATVVFTNKLEKLHRSAFPNALRGTLNKAAFDVKQNTMPESADKSFTIRQRNFFKANSRVEMAKGWDVKQMKSKVGFIGSSQAIEDLEKQEHGGTIKGRSFIPTDEARGGSSTKTVRPSNRLSRIKGPVNSARARGRTPREKFIKSAIHAGKGGYVIGNKRPKMLLKVLSVRRIGRNTVVRTSAIYSFEKDRSVRVSATGFMARASDRTAARMDQFYIQEAKRQFARVMR